MAALWDWQQAGVWSGWVAHRWKVERSLAWVLANRRLTVRYERRPDILMAFQHLACTPSCAHKLPRS